MATELTKKFTATLSNNYNTSAYAYQGGTSTSSKGATCTSRKGYFKFTGLSALAGMKINSIKWYLAYGSTGKSAKKTITFSSPSFSFTSGVVAYDNNETRTLTSGTPFDNFVNAIEGSGSLTLTMYNSETETTHDFSSGSGSYTENYVSVTSSYITVYYEEPCPFQYYDGSSWVKPEKSYYYDGSSWVEITAGSYYDGSAWQESS